MVPKLRGQAAEGKNAGMWTAEEVSLSNIWSSLLDLPLEEIQRHHRFSELGGDSLLSAELMQAMRQEWPHFASIISQLVSQQMPLAELAAVLKVGDASFVPENRFVALAKDNIRDSNYICNELASLQNPLLAWNTKAQILLTGSTGYLGANLLMELLKKTERSVYCFIRADSNEKAQERLAEILFGYNLTSKVDVLPSRVVCLATDLSNPNFGLEKGVYDKLATGIDVIYHCAAEVNLLKSFDELEGPNICGTKEILKLAMEKKVKPLHYISTVGVFAHYMSDDEPGDAEYAEERLASDINLEKYITGYSQTKAVAELLVWRAIDMGHPAVIYRPGEIGCHSTNKVINRSDFLYIMLRACAEVGCYPADFDWKFAYGSLDFIVNSILHISTGVESFGKVFHLIEENLHFFDFFKTKFGGQLKRVSLTEWKADIIGGVQKTKARRSCSNLVSLFLCKQFYKNMNYFELSNSHAGTFSNRNTLGFLKKQNALGQIQRSDSFLPSRYSDLVSEILTHRVC